MRKIFPSAFRKLGLLLVVFGLAGAGALPAAGLNVFKGATNGKYTGVYVIAQGPTTRIIGTANPVFSGSAKSGKFVIKGTAGSSGYQQTITLRPKGRVTVNPLFPAASGNFQVSVDGTYKLRGKKLSISAPINTPTLKGTFKMDIGYGTYGSALSITTRITFEDGSAPIFVTVTAS